MIREEEASKKVCLQVPIIYNDEFIREEYIYCLGQHCMKWEWDSAEEGHCGLCSTTGDK